MNLNMEQKDIERSNAEQSAEIPEQGMSKTQLKKLKKRMKWLETKHLRRSAEKQKKKQRLAERRERGEDLPPNRKKLKSNTMSSSTCKIRVCLDLSLEEYMSEKDIASLTLQIQFSYSSNRRAANPMQLYACGLGGRTQQRLDSIGDYKNWDLYFKEESYLNAFPKESIVYLSSESTNVLTSLSEDKVYIIGGLVDHNSHKGLCHRLAEENGIAHAQLPISEFLHLKGRKVLAVNHVFAILLRYTETGDWKEAFLSELPKRRGLTPVSGDDNTETKKSVDGSNSDSGEEDQEEDGELESRLNSSCDNSSNTTSVSATPAILSTESHDVVKKTDSHDNENVKTDQSAGENIVEDGDEL